MPKKKKTTKTIPAKVGAKASQKGGKFITKVVAEGTGTGGPGSRGGPGSYDKSGKKAKPISVSDIKNVARQKQQDKILMKRFGSSLDWAFPSNAGLSGSQRKVADENPDYMAEQIAIGIRDGIVREEQKRANLQKIEEAKARRENARKPKPSPRTLNPNITSRRFPEPQTSIGRTGLGVATPQRVKPSPRTITPRQPRQVLRLKGGRTLILKADPIRSSNRAPVYDSDADFETADELEEDDSDFESVREDEYSTDESDFEVSVPTKSRARRLPPVLEQPITNAERIRRMELKQFQVKSPEDIEAQRQRDLQQFKVGRDKILRSKGIVPVVIESESEYDGPNYSSISDSDSSVSTRRSSTIPSDFLGSSTDTASPVDFFSGGEASSTSSDSSTDTGSTPHTSELSSDSTSSFRRAVRRTAPSPRTLAPRERGSSEEREAIAKRMSREVIESALKNQRYYRRAGRGQAKEKLKPEDRYEITELEQRVIELKKILGRAGIGRPELARGATLSRQKGIKARLQELGLIRDMETEQMLNELFIKMRRIQQLRNKK